ncbi:MAG TPA: lipopolysaccharide biosynthesis protein [Candidatus Sulfotelmatobacter sp.]|jgi:capsule polysaccharide export protein KpsE/RkpR|nr:lipopolysaccharide biosynthesis protein [Candidatus Sulfotelmatobacter sp.]
MATRELTKRPPQYSRTERNPDLIPIAVPGRVEKLRVLWDRRSLIYRWAAIAFVASCVIALLIPVRYTAITRLMPPDQSGQGIASMFAAFGKSSELASIGSELFGMKTSGELFVGVLKSESVENAMVDKFDLRKIYKLRRYEDARKVLEGRTDLTVDRKSGIITIKVSDGSAERAAAMGREYVEQLNHVVISLDTSSAHRERVFLESRLKGVQQDLESAEKDFSQFASKNTALDVKEQGRAMIGAAAQLEGELIAAQTELEGLRQIYTNNNVRVRSVQARIDEYKRQLQKLNGQSPASGDRGPEVAPGAGQDADLYPSIRQLPILGVTWADLYRRTMVQEAVFETLTKQYELARVNEAREVPSVKVLDTADVPEKKSFPPRTIIVLFATGFAVAMCSVWILMNARWNEIDPNDPLRILAGDVSESIQHSRIGSRVLTLINSRRSSVVDRERPRAPRNQE